MKLSSFCLNSCLCFALINGLNKFEDIPKVQKHNLILLIIKSKVCIKPLMYSVNVLSTKAPICEFLLSSHCNFPNLTHLHINNCTLKLLKSLRCYLPKLHYLFLSNFQENYDELFNILLKFLQLKFVSFSVPQFINCIPSLRYEFFYRKLCFVSVDKKINYFVFSITEFRDEVSLYKSQPIR